jgi:hypothetical protein
MPVGSAVLAQVGFGVEATQNTRQVPNKFLGFTQEGVRGGPEQVKSRAIRAGRILPYRIVNGKKMWEGPVAIELQPETVGSMLRAVLDGTPVTTGAGPYTHVFNPVSAAAGDLKSLTLQIGRPDSAGTVRPHEYLGAMCRSWSITVEPAAWFVAMQAVVTAYDEDLSQSLVAASYAATETPFVFAHASMSIAGSEIPFDTLTMNGDNALEVVHKATAAAAGRPTIRPAGMRTIGGTFQTDFISNVQYQRFVNGTEASFSLALSAGGSASLTIAGNVRFSGETPNVGGRDEVLRQGCPFEFVSGTSDAAAFTATLITTDVTV